jgi:hypothetical protein
MHYPTHCVYVFCMISIKTSIFLKGINWSVLCKGLAVCQYVVMTVAMKTTLCGDNTPCSLLQVSIHLTGRNSPENTVYFAIRLQNLDKL